MNPVVDRLSPASVRSLALQGGPLTPANAAQFRSLPSTEEPIRVRRWNEPAQVPGLATAPLDHYRMVLEALLA